jgi:hypothetical protein
MTEKLPIGVAKGRFTGSDRIVSFGPAFIQEEEFSLWQID